MFTPTLGRALRSSNAISTPPVCTFGRVAASQQARPIPLAHQRRLSSSSSKPVVLPHGPADPNSTKGTANPRSKSKQQSLETGTTKVPQERTSVAAGKKEAPASPRLNVPSVDSTQHRTLRDLTISHFFSPYGPIPAHPQMIKSKDGLYTADWIPRQTTQEAFEAMLSPGDQNVHHLDRSLQPLDEFVAQLPHFHPPPAPRPLSQGSAVDASPRSEYSAFPFRPSPKRSFGAKIVVTESRDASGNRTFTAQIKPMEEMSAYGEEGGSTNEGGIRHTFLERVKQRRDGQTKPDMLAISVKRQRKLKMKKHKYKKLMKRTRLLRRKLDRL
ncbi:uncharacterized protein EI97DRAFT_456094 [Westerdykella ornata]|uniref:Small ribosomal subunit protein mS38 n=1 Tax=Westerdykella ornata TaxID=318751 RepID=A0A6A6JQH8_WESOR|nr:uncharacterized protein EI97DRAFT_456094 [Westerdykella ornata]KAF2278637.1 hypothetical protein EI97DRAFT_456094 [Westerdykella ornata]